MRIPITSIGLYLTHAKANTSKNVREPKTNPIMRDAIDEKKLKSPPNIGIYTRRFTIGYIKQIYPIMNKK